MKELRLGERLPLELPVQVSWKPPKGSLRRVQGKTVNIGPNGLFISMPRPLRSGKTITFAIRLPVELTKSPVELVCRGRVVRRHHTGKQQGIAAIIDDFHIRPLPRRAAKR
jgi:PilZ domain-containing protein